MAAVSPGFLIRIKCQHFVEKEEKSSLLYRILITQFSFAFHNQPLDSMMSPTTSQRICLGIMLDTHFLAQYKSFENSMPACIIHFNVAAHHAIRAPSASYRFSYARSLCCLAFTAYAYVNIMIQPISLESEFNFKRLSFAT